MKILIIEKDLIARLVIKNIIYKSLSVDRNQLDIYTTPNPLQGIGTCFVINPDIIIFDEKEYITDDKSISEYISSNKNILINSPIIIKNFSRFTEDRNYVEHYSQFLEAKLKEFNLSNGLKIDTIEKILLKLLYPSKKEKRYKNNILNKSYIVLNNLYLDLLTGVYRLLWDRKEIERDDLTVTYEKKTFNQRIYPKLFIASSITLSILLNVSLSLLPILGLGYLSQRDATAQITDNCIAIDKDFNQEIGLIDLASIATKYNDECVNTSYHWGCGSMDSNSDSSVDVIDLAYLVQRYNQSCFKGGEWFVSTTGSPTGDGSIDDPWDIATGLNSFNTIQPGDTLWLRGGTYGTGAGTIYQTKLIGTEESPIVIKSYPNEWAVIDGGIQQVALSGAAHMWFWGFEVTNSSIVRPIDNVSAFRSAGFDLHGPGTKVINLYINNTGHPSIGFWDRIEDGGEVYGTVSWGAGVRDDTPEYGGAWRGASIYGQNTIGNRNIENNIFFSNSTTGLSTHGVDGHVNNFTYRYNSVFNNNQADLIAYSTNHGASGLVIDNNSFYSERGMAVGSMLIGTFGNNYDATITNNIVFNPYKGIYFRKYETINLTNNLIISDTDLVIQDSSVTTYNSSNNKFISRGGSILKLDGVSSRTFSALTTHLSDSTSTYSRYIDESNKVLLKPNKYEYGKAHLTVYNFENKITESINPSTFLSYGDYYIVRDVLDYDNPIIKGRYLGSNITIPLHLYVYQPITGTVFNANHKHFAPMFNNYSIERVNSSSGNKVNAPVLVGDLEYSTSVYSVELTSTTPNALIYYTTDGSEPTTSSTLYSGAFNISSTVEIKAIAVLDGYEDSTKVKYNIYKIDLEDGLKGYYKLDEESGTTVLNSSNDPSKFPVGTTVGTGIERISGIDGGAYRLDGAGSYFNVLSVSGLTEAYSISGWAKLSGNSGTLLNIGSSAWSTVNFRLTLTASTNMVNNMTHFPGDFSGTGVESNNCNSVTEWNFYTVTFDGTSQRIYCNGIFKSITTREDGPLVAGTRTTMNVGFNGFDQSFTGDIDEIRIYNRTLNEREVYSLFNQFKDQI